MKKKHNKFTDLHFFIRHNYGKQKSLRIVEKTTTVQRLAVYGNVRLTKVPNEATLQGVG